MKLQEKMFAMVQAWHKSGMTRDKFLSDKSISTGKFNYWTRKYCKSRENLTAQLPAKSSSADFKSFVLSRAEVGDNRPSISMEIITPSGVRITIYH